jgi:protein-tyrosine-phosphatase
MNSTTADALEARLSAWEAAGPTGDAEHRAKLETLAAALKAQLAERGSVDVLFVCTHNSRRSHIAQVLALAAARHAGVPNVRTFSGGTEVTAFNPRAVAALRRAGVEITGGGSETNPRYSALGQPMFSKRLDDAENPARDFVAVMTCTQADAACPVVKGATRRVSVPYEDPKVADGTPEETQRYDERVEQIGRDLAWVMRQVSR